MTTIQNFQQRFRFVNSDGTLTLEASRLFRDWFARIGGSNGLSIADITELLDAFAVDPKPRDLSCELASIADELRQIPQQITITDDGHLQSPPQTPALQQDDLTPPMALIDAIEFLQTEVRSLAEQLGAARNEIESLKQGIML